MRIQVKKCLFAIVSNILLDLAVVIILGIVFLPNSLTAGLITDTWQMDAYIGWEYVGMDRKVVFDSESSRDLSYPFIQQQGKYMNDDLPKLAKDVKDHFQGSFTPLVIKIHRADESRDKAIWVETVVCESDSRIYRANKLGRFEYQYVNLLHSIGPNATFYLPPGVNYNCFWLFPSDSLIGKVYLVGKYEEGRWTDEFRIETEKSEINLEQYIKYLESKITIIQERIDRLRKRI